MKRAKNQNQEPLNQAEKELLAESKTALRKYRKAPFEAGRGLGLIRGHHLYREEYPSFQAYCSETFDCSRTEADLLIRAWRIHQLLAPSGVVLTNISQARALISLGDADIIKAGKLAVEIAAGKKLVARHFRLAANQLRAISPQSKMRRKAASFSPEKTLVLIQNAQEAINRGDKATALEALAQVRACLSPHADKQATPAAADLLSSNQAECHHGGGEGTPKTNLELPASASIESPPESSVANNPDATLFVQPQRIIPEDDPNHAPAVNPTPKPQKSSSQPEAIMVGGSSGAISRWRQVPMFVATWLITQGRELPGLTCLKRDAAEFPASARIKSLPGGWFMDVGDGREKLMRNARVMLDKSGLGNLPISVRLGDGQTLTT